MNLFAKGARWKHRNLGFVVAISNDPEPGKDVYTLTWDHFEPDPMGFSMIRGSWTAAEIVQNFSPIKPWTKWDALLSDEDPLQEGVDDLLVPSPDNLERQV